MERLSELSEFPFGKAALVKKLSELGIGVGKRPTAQRRRQPGSRQKSIRDARAGAQNEKSISPNHPWIVADLPDSHPRT